jgi:hypothetical protein
MSRTRFGVLIACVLGLIITIGVAQAAATGSNRALKLQLVHVTYKWTGPYWNRHTNPPTPPPIGETAMYTGIVHNNAAQFGKAANARVGRILFQCTVLTEPTDGLCTGIVHVPDGFFTIAGNGPFMPATVRHYAITGGVGRYANERGVFTTTRSVSGAILAQVDLSS